MMKLNVGLLLVASLAVLTCAEQEKQPSLAALLAAAGSQHKTPPAVVAKLGNTKGIVCDTCQMNVEIFADLVNSMEGQIDQFVDNLCINKFDGKPNMINACKSKAEAAVATFLAFLDDSSTATTICIGLGLC